MRKHTTTKHFFDNALLRIAAIVSKVAQRIMNLVKSKQLDLETALALIEASDEPPPTNSQDAAEDAKRKREDKPESQDSASARDDSDMLSSPPRKDPKILETRYSNLRHHGGAPLLTAQSLFGFKSSTQTMIK